MKKLFKTSPCSRVIASALGCAAISLLLTACGDETTNVTETTGMTLLEKGAKMPDCTADNAGQMVYSTDSAAAFFCANGKWQPLKGEKGEQGIQGEQGPQGEPGEGKQGPKGEGKQGAPGESCTAQKLASGDGYKIVCGGDSVGVVLDGDDGASAYELSGSTLSQSEWLVSLKGENGTSCSATQVTGGVQIDCTDGTSVTLNDGTNGVDGKSFVDGWMVDPRDKQLYRTVTIGDQVWMAENLNYAYTGVPYNYGDYTSDSTSWCYGDAPANCAKYGRLYTWAAAMDSLGTWSTNGKGCGFGSTCNVASAGSATLVRGICPKGWHLPSRTEWEALIVAVDGSITEYTSSNTAGSKLKSVTGWSDSGNGTDAFEFSALPAGFRDYDGYFLYDGKNAYFWSSTEDDSNNAYRMALYRSDDGDLDDSHKRHGFSVRCLMD